MANDYSREKLYLDNSDISFTAIKERCRIVHYYLNFVPNLIVNVLKFMQADVAQKKSRRFVSVRPRLQNSPSAHL